MIPTATFSIHRFLLSVLSHLPHLLSVPTVVSFTSLLSPSCSLAAEEHECELEFVSSISNVVKKKKKVSQVCFKFVFSNKSSNIVYFLIVFCSRALIFLDLYDTSF